MPSRAPHRRPARARAAVARRPGSSALRVSVVDAVLAAQHELRRPGIGGVLAGLPQSLEKRPLPVGARRRVGQQADLGIGCAGSPQVAVYIAHNKRLNRLSVRLAEPAVSRPGCVRDSRPAGIVAIVFRMREKSAEGLRSILDTCSGERSLEGDARVRITPSRCLAYTQPISFFRTSTAAWVGCNDGLDGIADRHLLRRPRSGSPSA